MCNPQKVEELELTDLMVCAPWAPKTFPCLTQGGDHRDCCRQNGLPDICVELCQGDIKRIDYRYFRYVIIVNIS